MKTIFHCLVFMGLVTGSVKGDCNNVVGDVVFMVDSSNSVGQKNFQMMRSFLEDIFRRLDIAGDKVRVAAASYSNDVKPAFYLIQSASKEKVIGLLDKLEYKGVATRTDLALEKVRTVFFRRSNGGRANVPKLAVILTDGASNEPELTVKQANLLHKDGVWVISIGIGDKINKSELRKIASYPADRHVFYVMNFDLLKTLTSYLTQRVCEVAKPPCVNRNWINYFSKVYADLIPMSTIQVKSFRECKERCLSAQGFVCRSVAFFKKSQSCRMYLHNVTMASANSLKESEGDLLAEWTCDKTECQYPYKHDNRTYDYCQKIPVGESWCSFTFDFDSDRKWISCPGGPEHLPCEFPFIYQGERYNSCINDDNNEPWCSLTENFDLDFKWRICRIPCHYPFLYKSKLVHDCVNDGAFPEDSPWCATTYNYDDDLEWRRCPK